MMISERPEAPADPERRAVDQRREPGQVQPRSHDDGRLVEPEHGRDQQRQERLEPVEGRAADEHADGERRRDAPRWIVDAEGGAQPLAEGVKRGHRPVRPRPTLSSTATSARVHPAWTRTSATSWGAASLSGIAARPRAEAKQRRRTRIGAFYRAE